MHEPYLRHLTDSALHAAGDTGKSDFRKINANLVDVTLTLPGLT